MFQVLGGTEEVCHTQQCWQTVPQPSTSSGEGCSRQNSSQNAQIPMLKFNDVPGS